VDDTRVRKRLAEDVIKLARISGWFVVVIETPMASDESDLRREVLGTVVVLVHIRSIVLEIDKVTSPDHRVNVNALLPLWSLRPKR